MSGLKTFSCVVVLCGAMVNMAIASPRIEARGQLGRDIGEEILVQQWELPEVQQELRLGVSLVGK
ncbi:hypothetical protein HpHA218_12740 [Helicobacter pylori]